MNVENGPVAVPDSFLDVFLQPGDFYWGAGNTRIRTLLGSCVSIVLWHPVWHTGGMCHFMLSGGKGDPKYAEGAMQCFMREIDHGGPQPFEYMARVFGGSNMFQMEEGECCPRAVGGLNVEAAYSLLSQAGIKVFAADTGGYGYRKLIFDLWSGSVWVREQQRIHLSPVNGGPG